MDRKPPIGKGELLAIQRRSDRAAHYAAGFLASALGSPLVENDCAPGLIDVSRSSHHRYVFPPGARKLPVAERDWLMREIHAPYRERIRHEIETLFLRNRYVIHLSVSTFAARANGKPRRADVGLAYDPRRDEEIDFCLDWIDELYDLAPMLRVRRNYPRRGAADCITKAMRAEFADDNYLGIELQLNRSWAARDVAIRDEVLRGMAAGLKEITRSAHSDAA